MEISAILDDKLDGDGDDYDDDGDDDDWGELCLVNSDLRTGLDSQVGIDPCRLAVLA